MIVKPTKALEIFYSYASEDEALRATLEKQLGNLKQQGLISDWHKGEVMPGIERMHNIDTYLHTASIILLLVSPDFLSSDYCYSFEMKLAMERHEAGEARVIPIILRPTDWKGTPFEKLAALPSDGKPVTRWRNRDEAFLNIAQGIRKIVEEVYASREEKVKERVLLREQYCQTLIERWKMLDFKGIMHVEMNRSMSIPLIDIFVFPDILTGVPEYETLEREERDRNYRTLKKERKELFQMDDQALLRGRSQRNKQRVTLQREPLSTALAKGSRLVILGDPGSGKSTLLRYIMLRLAERDATFLNIFPHFARTSALIPLYMTLAPYAEFWRSSSAGMRTLKHFLPQYLSDNYLDAYSDFLQYELEQGGVLLLLDGLDEIPDPSLRLQIVRQIEAFTQTYAENQFIVTSRIVGYKEAPLALEYQPHTLADFSEPQIQLFTQLWCPAYERWVRGTQNSHYLQDIATKEAEKLYNATQRDAGVKRLAVSPLLLTILALIQRQGRELPSHRVELFDLCTTTLLETWVRARGLSTQLSKSEIVKILRPLAFWMHEHPEVGSIPERDLIERIIDQLRDRGITEDEAEKRVEQFLQTVRGETGILIERGKQRYGFLHLTFEEFFAASELEQNEDTDHFIRQHLHNARWREVILLTVGIAGIIRNNEKQVTKLLQKVILSEESQSPFEKWLHRDLLFAGLCLADDVGPTAECEKVIIEQIAYLYLTSPYDTLRESFSNILRSWSGTPIVAKAAYIVLPSLLQQITNDNTLIISPPMMSFREHFQEKMMEYHQNLREEFTSVQTKIVRFLANITLRTNVADWVEVGGTLLKYPNSDVREEVVKMLGEVAAGQPEVVTMLLQAFTDSDWQVREDAVKALGEVGLGQPKVVTALLKMLTDSVFSVRKEAVKVLGKIGTGRPEVVKALLHQMITDADYGVRARAVRALGKVGVGQPEVVKALGGTPK